MRCGLSGILWHHVKEISGSFNMQRASPNNMYKHINWSPCSFTVHLHGSITVTEEQNKHAATLSMLRRGLERLNSPYWYYAMRLNDAVPMESRVIPNPFFFSGMLHALLRCISLACINPITYKGASKITTSSPSLLKGTCRQPVSCCLAFPLCTRIPLIK